MSSHAETCPHCGIRNEDSDLASFIIYYPHIPKAVVTLLQALYPSKYNSARVAPNVKKGERVKQWQTIARYEDIELTAPYTGRIEMLGNSQAGRYEWPETKGEHTKYLDYDSMDLSKEGDLFSFALRPIRKDSQANIKDHDELGWSRYYPVVRAFDRNDVGPRKRFMGFGMGVPTFHDLLDDAVANLKGYGGRIKVPSSLNGNKDFTQQLRRYWELINSAGARVVSLKAKGLGRHSQ